MALAKSALIVAGYPVLAALATMWLLMLVGSAWTMVEAMVDGESDDMAVAAFVLASCSYVLYPLARTARILAANLHSRAATSATTAPHK